MVRCELFDAIIIYCSKVNFSRNKVGTYHNPMRQVLAKLNVANEFRNI